MISFVNRGLKISLKNRGLEISLRNRRLDISFKKHGLYYTYGSFSQNWGNFKSIPWGANNPFKSLKKVVFSNKVKPYIFGLGVCFLL